MSFQDTPSGQIILKSRYLAKRAADPGLDFLKALYELAKRRPFISFIVFVFHVWVYGLAFHHIDEFKSIMEVLTFWAN